jgi:hypothetical protein
VRRPDDNLVLDLTFDNLRIEPDGEAAARLVRENPGRRGILIVELPPQSFGEEASLAEQSKLDTEKVEDELPPERNGRLVEADKIPGKIARKQNQPIEPPSEPLTGRLPARIRVGSPFGCRSRRTHWPSRWMRCLPPCATGR